VTDIVVLVVAADDSVMPQTIEAISHAKNAGVAAHRRESNKIDLPQANAQKVKQEALLQHSVVLESSAAPPCPPRSRQEGTNVPVAVDQISSRPKFSTQGESRIVVRSAPSSKPSSIRARAPSPRCSSRTAR